MSLEIRDPLAKYVRLTDDGKRIDRFVCPVEGCSFTTKLGAGALRMHLLLKGDSTKTNMYCEAHDQFCKSYSEELSLDIVRYLSNLPRIELET